MNWRKSSFSQSSGNCVEVRQDLNALRDSKNPAGPALSADLPQLLATIKSGKLHH
ncbi:DUF397 domain-containing protein [Labedaea rhizosphaerae]|uniref:Uncharacterized protein DUF397 n=1 Tax=Labedaea rhizosphaerae TaxID=598644 RepID=A0A4V3CZU6_LABRH|nr:DUF397 domain-containing protein [Labedaea rhizosphaerae]TDQ01091.1 uncharacterized protein DUF397 [Labedaea rhizosphaerae]